VQRHNDWHTLSFGKETSHSHVLTPSDVDDDATSQHFRVTTWNTFGRSGRVHVECRDVAISPASSAIAIAAPVSQDHANKSEPSSSSLLAFYTTYLFWLDEVLVLTVIVLAPLRMFIYGDANFFLRLCRRLPPNAPTRVEVTLDTSTPSPSAAATARLRVKWDRPLDNHVDIVCYCVRYVDEAGLTHYLKLTERPLPTLCYIPGLKFGLTYKFTVEATNSFGLVSKSAQSTYMATNPVQVPAVAPSAPLVPRDQCYICLDPTETRSGGWNVGLHYCSVCDRQFCNNHKTYTSHNFIMHCPAINGKCVCSRCLRPAARPPSAALLAAAGTYSTTSNKSPVYHPDSHNKDKNGVFKYVKPIECDDGHVIVPWEVPDRALQLEKLKSKDIFDVVVIGGGATGAGCALDAATRGMKVAMVERSDFGAGTSGRSTKLIHGGIRYLETAFMKLDIAAYKLMYDLVAGHDRSVPGSYFIDSEEALYQYPNLKKDGLKGAIVYYDGQMNDTRMNLSLVLTAVQSGATVSNYVQVLSILKDEHGRASGVHVKDANTGDEWDIHAKAVINATGPFTDSIREMDDPAADKICVPAAGVHVVLPDHFSPNRMGLIVPKTTDGRVLFYLPWENGTLAGTTDSESAITMLPSPTKAEIQFILNESNRYLNATVTEADIRSSWSGIRPLVKDPRHSNTAQISREHVLDVSASNMVTIAGGKWTTYRRMAQDTIDKVQQLRPDLSQAACRTRMMQLVGADRIGEVCNQKFDRITITLREKYHMDKDIAEHLTKNYGTRALQLGELESTGFLHRKAGDHPKRLHPKYPYVESEVIFAVQQEYAVRAVDVLARRTRLAFVDAVASDQVMDKVIGMMAQLLQWDKKRCAAEKQEATEFLATMHIK
ncbi:hypothetical protein DYB30_011362, partial [Aphanomyces astaci]